MNYELVTELYEAGFPRIEHDSDGINPDYPTHITLSELIEALNNKVDYLFGSLNQMSDITWEAEIWESDIKGKGKTPEEAVANLYLALHAPNK